MASGNRPSDGNPSAQPRSDAAVGFMPWGRSWQAGNNDAGAVDLRRLLMLIWRRKYILFGCMLGAMLLTYISLMFVTPRYTARSYIKIQTENVNPASIELQNFMTSMRLDTALVLSEVEVLKSRQLAKDIILSPELSAYPEFKTIQDEVKQAAGKVAAAQSKTPEAMGVKAQALNEGMSADMLNPKLASAIDRLQGSLLVRAIPGSFVVQVNYTDVDAAKAAAIANLMADVYIDRQLDEKFKATQKVTGWLDARLNVLRDQLRSSEQAVEAYKAKNNMVQGARYDMTSQQLTELNTQLVGAQADRAEAQAKLEQINRWLANPSDAELTSDLLQSHLILNIKQVETDIMRRRAEMLNKYGPRHPSLQAIDSELANVRINLADELRRLAAVLQNDLKSADARVQSLEGTFGGVEGEKVGQDQAMVGLRELEREATSNRVIYDAFLERYKRSTDQEKLEDADAEIISYAAVPNAPSYPNRPLFVTLAAAMGLFGGIMLILMLEKIDNTFRSSSQLEQKTGFPCYALVPQAEVENAADLANFVQRKPTSSVAESLRTLRMSLALRGQQMNGEKPKIVAITSSLPNEGKSTLSYWMARQAAKSGERVILIDCDLRRPSLHRLIKRSSGPTLVDFLTGEAKLEDVIVKDEATGLHMLTARGVPNTALDLLQSDTMKNLLTSLKTSYDLVLLDTPAALAVTDSRVVAMQADFTLYVVQWDGTSREVVQAGIRQFTDFGYDKIGLVINRVDIRRHAAYGYGDTAYYYGRKEYAA